MGKRRGGFVVRLLQVQFAFLGLVIAIVQKMLAQAELPRFTGLGWGNTRLARALKGPDVYNFAHSDVAEKPGVRGNSLKRMVGARGFEPPTPWSRTRFQGLLKSMDSCCF